MMNEMVEDEMPHHDDPRHREQVVCAASQGPRLTQRSVDGPHQPCPGLLARWRRIDSTAAPLTLHVVSSHLPATTDRKIGRS